MESEEREEKERGKVKERESESASEMLTQRIRQTSEKDIWECDGNE